MHVLHLITTTRSFFEQQISVLEDRGVDCTVIGVPGEYTADSPRTPTDYLRFYPQVLSHVRTGDYDLVHGHYGLVAPFALAQPTRPVVMSLWGTDLMSDMGWLETISRYGARFADAAIVPSPAMSRELDVDHLEIPFGIDTDLFRPIPRRDARERVGWDADERIALFPYDPDRDEKDYPRAERIADLADAELDVRTIEGVPYEEMPYYMNASDLLLVTSKREAGPMAVKEAAACNVPVVSTDVGFVRETVGEVDNCVVSDDDRELAAGLESVLAGSRRSNGREAIDGLSLESMGDRLIECYRTVLEQRGRDTTELSPEQTEEREGTYHGI
ncbi:glycosyltransferase family 4 protein [Natronococcus jeotgali]|uniref:Group 1 glycosyl transferase n=1 Tax=Natronococcus jeotgali DSM 18795 TaxID=1227498 RepID=L9XVY3_9EURY|nr:glycosyltransferase family 4 protein [Natronococcus jeotgali]ELY64783.1 group 1 glycosyl transferase [Natronococcus jeotgali DSM 18795]